ncbi:NADPH-dependent diflavin oxidoreductase 1 [Armadillidium vulgare]|nr:NADPH-dependent diflavin oxidoreductase 1 [Armadillidium vulgare]
MTLKPELKTRLEVNFMRLIDEAQQIANGNKSKDWKFEKEERKILILYGSETGTAEEAAERIGRESLRFFFKPIIKSMNDCSLQELTEEKLVVFVAATTGQGDDPTNMKTFFQTLWNKRSNRNLLKDMYYGVLGLGDSSYQKFNFAAKRLNKLIQILGAKSIINIGLADDQHELGPDFIIDKWIKELFEVLLNLYPLPSGLQPITEYFLPPPKYHIKFVESESLDVQSNVENSPKPSDAFSRMNEIEMKISSITKNLRKTSTDHFQDVRLIEFDVTSLSYSHNPGDILTIQPQNLDEYVEEFIECLGLERHRKFYIFSDTNNFKPSPHLPQPCTVEQCVKCYFDIQCVPKRHFFELLSHFTTDENEKEKFLEFASAEGQEEMFNYCTRPKRSILESSCRLSIH